MKMLAGKRTFVTGGSRGLGAAICREFARQGANVGFLYQRDAEGAAATVKDVEALGARCVALQGSVTDEKAVGDAVKAVETAFGGIDVLVNNAGISQPLPLALLDAAEWAKVMDVNATGSFIVARRVLRTMVRARSGVVLNCGSLAGVKMLEAPVHYTASKAAVKGMTEALAKEVGKYGIRVNCIAPGLLDDGLGRSLPDHKKAQYFEHIALGRPGTFDEVARCAAFLVSDRNRYMNGSTVVIDGGF